MSYRRRRKRIDWKIAGPIIIALIGALGLITVAIIENWIPFGASDETPTPDPIPVVNIKSIADGDTVEAAIDSAHGTYERVPDDMQIWLVAWEGTTCFPMAGPAVKEATGVWRHGPLEFPVIPINGQIKLSTVMATAEAAALLRTATGKLTGLPCWPIGVEIMETVNLSINQADPDDEMSPTEESTSLPTEIPTISSSPANFIQGKVCEKELEDRTNAIFLRNAEFNSLSLQHLQPGVLTRISLGEDGSRSLDNVSLYIGTDEPTCVLASSLGMLSSLGLIEDLEMALSQRPDHSFSITEMPIEINIESPKEGAIVGPDIHGSTGTYSGNIPSDRDLWLIVFIDGNYYPQGFPATLVSDNEWIYGTIYFGGENAGYSILAVLADVESSSTLIQYNDGGSISELPEGAIIYDQVDVVRNQ